MSVTLDANVLVYASNEADSVNDGARALLERLARGPDIVYLFWPALMGYLRVMMSKRHVEEWDEVQGSTLEPALCDGTVLSTRRGKRPRASGHTSTGRDSRPGVGITEPRKVFRGDERHGGLLPAGQDRR